MSYNPYGCTLTKNIEAQNYMKSKSLWSSVTVCVKLRLSRNSLTVMFMGSKFTRSRTSTSEADW